MNRPVCRGKSGACRNQRVKQRFTVEVPTVVDDPDAPKGTVKTNADGIAVVEATKDVLKQRTVIETRDVGEYRERTTYVDKVKTRTKTRRQCGMGKGGGCRTVRYNQRYTVKEPVTERVWVKTGTEEVEVARTYTERETSATPLISGSKEEQDAFINATAWRFANDKARFQLSTTPRSILSAGTDLKVQAKEDIYVVGTTTLAAKQSLSLRAGRRIGLLSAVNTNFQLTDLAHKSFIKIGETLQDGTLLRDPYSIEVGAGADETVETGLEFADKTASYALAPLTLVSGADMTLSAGEDVLNFAGSLAARGDLIVAAERDIRNEALRHNFTLTKEHGCVGRACGGQGHDFVAGEFLAGGSQLLSAGGDIRLRGGTASAATHLLAEAEGNITVDAITSQYLYYYTKSSKHFGLSKKKKKLQRAVIQEGEFATLYGDLILRAGIDLESHGSRIHAGGTVELTAERDIKLWAKSEELLNYYKKSGFHFVGYSKNKVKYNEFLTAMAEVQGQNIGISAGRNAIGIGAALFAADDLSIDAGNDVNIDAHQNVRFVSKSGWSIGISFAGDKILKAAFDNDGDALAVLESYMNTNGALVAVHQLAKSDDGWDVLNNLIALGYETAALGAEVSREASKIGQARNLTSHLAEQFNPFSDWETFSLDPNSKGFLNGIGFRFGMHKSRHEWTESHISHVIAGRDLSIDADHDVVLAGGTVASAGRDNTIIAGNDILVTALADWQKSKSSSWGVSVGFSDQGWTIGADYARSRATARLYTNAAITSGRYMTLISGRDTVLAGADVRAQSEPVGADVRAQPKPVGAVTPRVSYFEGRSDRTTEETSEGQFFRWQNGTLQIIQGPAAEALRAGEWTVDKVNRKDYWQSDYGAGTPQTVAFYSITAGPENASKTAPKQWVLQASNDGVNWTELHTVSGEKQWSEGETRKYTIGAPKSYRYYRFAGVEPNKGKALHIAELHLNATQPQRTAGEHVPASIYMDAGRDLVVASKQNTSDAKSFGFAFSVSESGAFSLSGNYAVAKRRYTDTPTIIEAEGALDIYVEGTTYLLGSALNSRSANLKLDTGDFVFDNYKDKQTSSSFGVSISNDPTVSHPWDAGVSISYSDKRGITYATVGEGDINIRNKPGQDISALNRNIGDLQKVTSRTNFSIAIPGLNFAKLADDIEATANVVRALRVPDSVRLQGTNAVAMYQRLILNGYTAEEARRVTQTPAFTNAVRSFRELDKAIKQFGSYEAVPLDVRRAIAMNESLLYVGKGKDTVTRVLVECGLFGRDCNVDLKTFLEAANSEANKSLVEALRQKTLEKYTAQLRDVENVAGGTLELATSFGNLILACTTEEGGAKVLSDLFDKFPRLFGRLLTETDYDPGKFLAALLEHNSSTKVDREQIFFAKIGNARFPQTESITAKVLGQLVQLTPVGTVADTHQLYLDIQGENFYAAIVGGTLIAIDIASGGAGKLATKPIKAMIEASVKSGDKAVGTLRVFTRENAFDIIDQFRSKKGGLDPLGDYLPVKGDGKGTVAFVDLGGKPVFGVNSSVLVKNADKNLGRYWRDRIGFTKGQDQVVWHGEAHSLMRAHQKTGGNMPTNLTMYSDRPTCDNCQTYLPELMHEMGVNKLTIHFKNPNVAPLNLTAVPRQ